MMHLHLSVLVECPDFCGTATVRGQEKGLLGNSLEKRGFVWLRISSLSTQIWSRVLKFLADDFVLCSIISISQCSRSESRARDGFKDEVVPSRGWKWTGQQNRGRVQSMDAAQMQ